MKSRKNFTRPVSSLETHELADEIIHLSARLTEHRAKLKRLIKERDDKKSPQRIGNST